MARVYGWIMNAKSAYSAIYGAWLTGFVIGARGVFAYNRFTRIKTESL